ncbi:helix-turn-helix domain-containing protein [Dongia sp.]|uniref:helix-turn-helix domain-containing protein n=1 Tax=Dongia sp. TaxID=1977262 RepID=UPI003750445F
MDDSLYRLFGDRVREIRDQKNVTQEELARRVDLSRTSITNIEKGRQRVLLHQVVEIASALDVNVRELMPAGAVAAQDPALRPDVARVVEILKSEAPKGD